MRKTMGFDPQGGRAPTAPPSPRPALPHTHLLSTCHLPNTPSPTQGDGTGSRDTGWSGQQGSVTYENTHTQRTRKRENSDSRVNMIHLWRTGAPHSPKSSTGWQWGMGTGADTPHPPRGT